MAVIDNKSGYPRLLSRLPLAIVSFLRGFISSAFSRRVQKTVQKTMALQTKLFVTFFLSLSLTAAVDCAPAGKKSPLAIASIANIAQLAIVLSMHCTREILSTETVYSYSLKPGLPQ